MKNQYLLLLFFLIASTYAFAQEEMASKAPNISTGRLLSIEPGIGIHTNFGTDVLMTTLVQWNPIQRLSFASHSSFNINNVTARNFNHITTDYNYSINQKFGAGTTLNGRKTSQTFLLMAGVKYTTYQETLRNPDLATATASIKSLSPDYGLMYSLKRGWKKYFFTGRMYVPLFPWPTKGSNITYIDGNSNNIALEAGVGIKIK
ncbi:hypothetical protein RT717_11595 [Imperialibacter roseus]|uniref:Outer membrane protein beta-barrel domain-containing protein n=1 Tax=Imperialibacter roseus TaxID=1324217 RepID=A0ABZ0IXN8_9BACT|nr:hypothetical protein [Imperialibacter roseus]WOK09282.1 hypothetical protein RT717_11595 [Imperialibacter roseus]